MYQLQLIVNMDWVECIIKFNSDKILSHFSVVPIPAVQDLRLIIVHLKINNVNIGNICHPNKSLLTALKEKKKVIKGEVLVL